MTLKSKDTSYKKADINYGYIIDRKMAMYESRYQKDAEWYVKKNSDNSNQAVILCAGDLMCEPVMAKNACYDGSYFFHTCFKQITPVLRNSDLTLANLETTVTQLVPYADEKHIVTHLIGKRYHCNAPVEYLDALRYAGFDGFALANNHCADAGYDGLIDTLKNLDDRDFMRVGAFRNENEPRVLLVNVNGIRLGVFSYTEHINRNLDRKVFTGKGCEVLFNRYSDKKIQQDIACARKSGAEFLLCYIHFLGKEYSHEVVDSQRKLAQKLADAGIDCVVGTHPHAIQEYDIIKCKDGRRVPVMYSLGNFITSDSTSMITRNNVIYKIVLHKVNGKVFIQDETYIPCRVVESMARSSQVVFPTQKKYHPAFEPDILNKAQAEIGKYVGSKIRLDEEGKESAVQ